MIKKVPTKVGLEALVANFFEIVLVVICRRRVNLNHV
jgi:hypothetical protein